MIIKTHVSIGLVGATQEREHIVPDDEWDDLDESEKEEWVEMYAQEDMWEVVDYWGEAITEENEEE